jgi:hypothetical protein
MNVINVISNKSYIRKNNFSSYIIYYLNMEKTTVIILISLVVLVLGVFFFGIRSTTKTIDKTFQEAKEDIFNDRQLNRSKVMIGGSKSKTVGVYSCLTTRNVFILLGGFFIGYIVSRF